MANNKYLQNLLFIGQDTLQEIRENKNHQRNTTFNFIIIISILFGLFEILKNKFKIDISYKYLKPIIILYGLLTLYLLIRLQISLSNYRKRLTKIWDDNSFKFAFERGILKY